MLFFEFLNKISTLTEVKKIGGELRLNFGPIVGIVFGTAAGCVMCIIDKIEL